MSKIYFFFLYLISIIPIIKSNDCESESNLTTRYDCLKHSTSNERCCFSNSNSNSSCKLLKFEEVSKNVDYDCGAKDLVYQEYDFSQYHPNQDSVSSQINFISCGKLKPSKKSQCTKYSQITNSCCFFRSGGGQACFYIGKKYTGPHKKMYMNGDVSFECSSMFLKLSFFILGFFIFI